MRNVSAAWHAAVSSTHQMSSRARLVTPGQSGTNPGPLLPFTGKPQYELPLIDGDVHFDPKAEVRANADCTVVWPWPASAADPMNVYRRMELFLETGIVHGDGATEWVGLGYYDLSGLDQNAAPNGPILIKAPDRMALLIKSRLPFPRQFAAATTIRAVVESLVHEVYPAVPVVLEGFNPDVAIGYQLVVEEDRYGPLNEIAKAYGCTVFFDYQGRFVMRPVPALGSQPVAYIRSGQNGTLVRLGRSLSNADTYNGFVATGEQTGDVPPVRVLVTDDDPLSPTMWGGPFGRIPKFFSSDFIVTEDQARTAAAAMRTRETGVPYTINFGAVPNAALEPLDPVGVVFAEQGTELHVLDELRIPLGATGVMTGTTRAKTRLS